MNCKIVMERTKVVIRKLPPNVAEADVRDLVTKTAAKYTWFSFVQGKIRYTLYLHGPVQGLILGNSRILCNKYCSHAQLKHCRHRRVFAELQCACQFPTFYVRSQVCM